MSKIYTINYKGVNIQLFKPAPIYSSSWDLIDQNMNSYTYKHSAKSLMVIVSGEIHNDTKYLHVSYSYPDRIPEYSDTLLVKYAFIGDREAYMVFPTIDKHVNIHPYCLHLFSPETPVLPDFTRGLGII